MRQTAILFLTVVLAAVSPVSVFAASPEQLVGAERAAALRAATGPVTEVQTKNPVPKLLPEHSELKRFVSENMDSLEPNILVETLYLYRKPSGQAGNGGWGPEERTGLFNKLTALSSLKGIQYYSESRKTMRTFYETSQVIDSPEKKNPLPDPVFASVPASHSLYARQKDLTFGDNIYRFDYRAGTDSFFFMQENVTAMTAGIIPAIGKNKLKSVFAVIDTGDSLLLYAAAIAKTASLPGMGDRIGVSFTNRAIAVINWFTVQADGVF